MTTAILINVVLAGAILAIVLSIKAWAIRTQHHDGIHFAGSQRIEPGTPAPGDAIRVAEPRHSDGRTPARHARPVHGQRGFSRRAVGAED
jgi:hypothetical protein